MAEYINYWLKEMIKNTPNDAELGNKIRQKSWEEQKETKYIYESPDKGKTVYRRKFGDYDSPRELISTNEFKNSEKLKINNMNMISLYDYLGHAAGPELGKQVASAAARAGVKHEIREVKHAGWNGPIMLYPKSFLDNFFGGGLNEGTSGKQLLKG
tara:strand:- start:23 stop:490 length:468 start_codon:yes stop_codon:yes gene_type:complete